MSVFSRVFKSGAAGGGGGGGGGAGGAGGKKAPSVTDALQSGREHIETLNQKVEHVSERRKKELLAAKKCMAQGKTGKEKALPHIRRAKMLEKQIQQIQGQIDNLEALQLSLEIAGITKGTAANMGEMKNAMMATGLDINKVEDTIDDVRETMQNFEEVTNAMSQPMMGNAFDDDELLEEFDAELQAELEDELTADGVQEDGVLDDLPAVPSTALPKPTAAKAATKEHDEMAELAAWAN